MTSVLAHVRVVSMAMSKYFRCAPIRVGRVRGAMPLVLRAKCVVVGEGKRERVLEGAGRQFTRCVCAGDAAVGKSALVQSLVSDGTKFPKSYSMVG